MVEEFGTFIEVFVDVSVEEATRRDTKQLYARAFRGEIPNLTGVNDPYERPEQPDLWIDSENETPEESARRVIALLEERNLIPATVTV